MTANYIAKMVENSLQEIISHPEDQNRLYRFNRSIGLLEQFIQYNFIDFEETELVYTHARHLCLRRQHFSRWYRVSGFTYRTKKESLDRYHEISGFWIPKKWT
jgi:hypothetical protein